MGHRAILAKRGCRLGLRSDARLVIEVSAAPYRKQTPKTMRRPSMRNRELTRKGVARPLGTVLRCSPEMTPDPAPDPTLVKVRGKLVDASTVPRFWGG